MDEDVLAATGVRLRQETQVGDERHAPVGRAEEALPFPVPALHADHEQTAPIEKGPEVERGEDLIARVARVDVDEPRRERRDVVGAEPLPEPRIPNVAAGLARQMVQGAFLDLLDVDPDRRDAPGEQREPPLSRQRQQGAVLGNGGFPGVGRHEDDLLVVGGEHETALRGQSRRHPQEHVAVLRHVESETLQRRRIPFRGVHRHLDGFRFGENGGRHFALRPPAVGPVNGAVDRSFQRQQPGPHAGREVPGVDLVREVHQGGLHRAIPAVADDRGGDVLHAEVTLPVRNAHMGLERLGERDVASRGLEGGRHLDGDELIQFRYRQDGRVNVGGPVVRTVLHPVAQCPPDSVAALTDRHAEAPLEVPARDRMGELQAHDSPPIRGLDRVLHELRIPHRRGERRRGELRLRLGEPDAGSEKLGRQTHAIRASRGPVLGRLEDQAILRLETPFPGGRRPQVDSRFDRLPHQVDPRSRENRRFRHVRVLQVVEVERNRSGHEPVLGDRRKPGAGDGDACAQRLGERADVDVAGRRQDGESEQPGERPAGAAHPDPPQPGGRQPRELTKQC